MRHHHHHRGATRIVISGSAGAMVSIVVMFFVGVLLIGMGAVFMSIAQSTPILHDSFLLTGGILVCVGVVLLGVGVAMWIKRSRARRLETGGVPGQL